jgi:hypothetical protein
MLKHIYNDYLELGLRAIPFQWDIENNIPKYQKEGWSNPETKFELLPTDNALQIVTGNGWAALDFDLKNTSDKTIFDKWMQMVNADAPDLLGKLFIERTRSNGYHVFLRYDKLPKKMNLAQSHEGREVIALYCNGPLIYTYPTPNYVEVHQSMNDVEILNYNEYNYLIGVSQYFNEYKPDFDPNQKAVNYPKGFEIELAKYDNEISDESFEILLETIDLFPIRNFRYSKKDRFIAYRRKGSESNGISAKVYPRSKRVLIFSASMLNFPNWHTKDDFEIWSLPPSFILYYHLKRDWNAVLNYIGIKQNVEIKFPFEIFPEHIRESLFQVAGERSMSPEFLATAGLWTISSLAGSSYTSDIGGAKNILFCFLVAPMSVGKSPAYEVMCQNPMKAILDESDSDFDHAVKKWEERKANAMKNKEHFFESQPRRIIPFLKDGTIEGYISLCVDQPNGIGIYIDEAEDIMNAGAYKSNNNSISFLTQAFNGGRYVQSRANRDNERVVKNMNINLLMGTQTERLHNIFPKDKIYSGFASRFLMCESDYKLLNIESDPFSSRREIHSDWVNILGKLYDHARRYNTGESQPIKISITNDAIELYRYNHKLQLTEANERITNRLDGFILGTHAKMSNYVARLTQVVAILQNPTTPVITKDIVIVANRLYKYYTETTIRLISKLFENAETGLSTELNNLYLALPDEFTKKDAVETCKRINLPPRRFETSIRSKEFASLFNKLGHGKYSKK